MEWLSILLKNSLGRVVTFWKDNRGKLEVLNFSRFSQMPSQYLSTAHSSHQSNDWVFVLFMTFHLATALISSHLYPFNWFEPRHHCNPVGPWSIILWVTWLGQRTPPPLLQGSYEAQPETESVASWHLLLRTALQKCGSMTPHCKGKKCRTELECSWFFWVLGSGELT